MLQCLPHNLGCAFRTLYVIVSACFCVCFVRLSVVSLVSAILSLQCYSCCLQQRLFCFLHSRIMPCLLVVKSLQYSKKNIFPPSQNSSVITPYTPFYPLSILFLPFFLSHIPLFSIYLKYFPRKTLADIPVCTSGHRQRLKNSL
jgi:hypothetical protein